MAKISTLVFPLKDDHVYLSRKKRGFGEGFLNGYGGRGNPGEHLEQTVVRELEEEAGIQVAFEELEEVAIVNFYRGEELLYECHVYFLREWNGDFIESDEMAYPEKYLREQLPYENMWKGDLVWIPLIIKGEKIKANMYYTPDMKEMVKFEYTNI